ncbi:Mu transposase C-terminal domain-containing protein [Streptomyces collinus]|uniref:Mu transposase C-terminal domain-containing protein n=1 Tax=Streptomyces collinus TaxID=42684 RepID=UPI0036991216
MPATDLWTFTLEDAGTRTLTTRGIRFRRRDYGGAWMTGQAETRVRIRFMPHHDHREVYHAATAVIWGRRTWPTRRPRNRSARSGGHGPPAAAV